jgi:hypothetical protein
MKDLYVCPQDVCGFSYAGAETCRHGRYVLESARKGLTRAIGERLVAVLRDAALATLRHAAARQSDQYVALAHQYHAAVRHGVAQPIVVTDGRLPFYLRSWHPVAWRMFQAEARRRQLL